jgi:spore coat polysaccharide biosynthesis protein SpsF
MTVPAIKTIAIIQARMGSTRLPGKVLKALGGVPVLEWVTARTRRSRLIDEVIVATTLEPADDIIVTECARLGLPSTRGSVEDVLDRYWQAARLHCADVIVRITSDCPLIDPELVDVLIEAFRGERVDYASNAIEPTYPRGVGAEVMTMAALDHAHREAKVPYQRVHVTPYLYENPDLFRILSVKGSQDHSSHRWTLDTPDDLELLRAIFARCGNPEVAGWREILAIVEREPELSRINQHVLQKALEQG